MTKRWDAPFFRSGSTNGKMNIILEKLAGRPSPTTPRADTCDRQLPIQFEEQLQYIKDYLKDNEDSLFKDCGKINKKHVSAIVRASCEFFVRSTMHSTAWWRCF